MIIARTTNADPPIVLIGLDYDDLAQLMMDGNYVELKGVVPGLKLAITFARDAKEMQKEIDKSGCAVVEKPKG
jgi:hypothetical protein